MSAEQEHAEEARELRAELAASENLVAALQAELAATAQRAVESVREAREEQREACGQTLDGAEETAFLARLVRLTPLHETPLGDRVKRLTEMLEASRRASDKFSADADNWRAERDALKAQVERLTAAIVKLRDHGGCGCNYPQEVADEALKEKP